jgi:3-hydroxyacyl-CoA dehydrogenase
VAGLHGSALGGGLELALAAHGRVAQAGARLGLPEVGLGILPGAGGTQRLPRLIGAEAALKIMLTGRPVPAKEALRMGIVDRVVEDDLEGMTITFARGIAKSHPVPTRDRRDGFRDPAAYGAAVALARKAAKSNPLPGHARIVDCVEAAQLLPFDQGQAFESAAFADLVSSPEAIALRHLFFAERAAVKIPAAKATPMPVNSVTVLGAGEDGTDLVMLLLDAGLEVVLADVSKADLVPGLERVVATLDKAVASGKMTVEDKDARWSRLVPDLAQDLESLGDVLFVTGVFASKK